MKVLFLQRDPFIKFGITVLSSVLKKNNHECELLVDNLESDIVKKAVDINPDIVAFSVTTSEYAWIREVGRKIKDKLKKPIICGGPHPTFYREFIKEDYLDAICLGEGEGAILDLAEAYQKGQDISAISNLIVKKDGKIYENGLRPLIDDLDSIPLPDFSIYGKYDFFSRQRNGFILTGRGCPFQCAFCFNKLYNKMYGGKGRVIRKHKAGAVIDEIKSLTTVNTNINYINFLDDTFILSAQWLDEFLSRYAKEINLSFSCSVHVNLISEDLIRKLKSANCFSVRLGVESGNEHLRNAILKKGLTDKQIIESVSLIRKSGLRFLIYNILGAPGETTETALETFRLMKRLRPTYAWSSLLQPYPGTEIYEYASKNNFLDNDYKLDNLENSYFMSSPIKNREAKEIGRLQKIFAFCLFLRLPERLVRLLIKLSLNWFYEKLFKLNYAIGIMRVDNLSPVLLIKTALVSKNYFKK